MWLNFGISLDTDLASALAKILAHEFGGAPNSADWRHFGRLAGFTNRKPHHVRPDGSYPFVLLHTAKSRVVSSAAYWIQRAAHKWLADAVELFRAIAARRVDTPIHECQTHVPPERFFRNQLDSLMRTYGYKLRREGGDFDASKADWMIVCKMLKHGYSEEQTKGALLQCSPQLFDRKSANLENYVSKTVERARMRISLKS